MPISENEKNLLLKNRGKPMVGLIHKITNEILFAPCIPQKVFLKVNASGGVESGYFLDDKLKIMNVINPSDLEIIDTLLRQSHVPRLALSDYWDEKTAHEFLFEQKCNSTKRSSWGGFSLTLDDLDKFQYQFVSGAFNSAPGQRTKGAVLSEELQNEVIRQTSALIGKTVAAAEEEKTCLLPTLAQSAQIMAPRFKTPLRKRQRPIIESNLSLFSCNLSDDLASEETFKVSHTSLHK